MFFRIYKPAPALASYVKCYWILEYDSVAGSTESILPDGSPELIFHFGNNYRSNINGNESLQPPHLVVGQLTRSIKLQPTGTTGIFAVRFYPWGLYPFVQSPVSVFTDTYVRIEDVISTAKYGNISEQLLNVAHDDKVRVVDAWLLNMLAQQPPKMQRHLARIAPVLQYMYSHNTSIQVNDMAGHANISIRQFNRLANDVTGLPPKQLSRILRFNGFMEEYQACDGRNLTQLLYQSGYYDQSHFIRDFKEITGETPLSFFNKPNELGELMLF